MVMTHSYNDTHESWCRVTTALKIIQPRSLASSMRIQQLDTANEHTISHEIQNDIIKVMAMHVLRNVATCLQQSPFLTLMMDETTDISNNEQTTIVIRWVSEHLEVHEEFLGLYHVPSIDALTLTTVSKDALVRMNLSMSKLRGQCYDGASTMRGARSGVAKRILDEEPKAVYTHCYGHSINLAASDAVRQTKLMRNMT